MDTNTNITETQVEGQVQNESTPAESFTREEVERMIQAEADRRVTMALQKQQKKTEQKIAEATKLAQMNEAEKYEYQLKQRELAIEEKEKALALAENRNEAGKILAERGISLTLVDFVVAEDADTMKMNIDTLDRAFKQSVKEEVEKRLASKTPRQNLPLDKEITVEQFRKMSMMELAQLATNNPELYNRLSNT